MQHFIKKVFSIFIILIFITPHLVFAQAVPAFISELKSMEDFNNLPLDQKKEAFLFMRETGYNPLLNATTTDESNATAEGIVNCFDYYRFGSVQVDMSTNIHQTIPGSPVSFSGKVKNENAYPVVDGKIYVKIFRIDSPEGSETQGNGHPLVDQFTLPETYNLPANSARLVSFDWNIPQNAEAGEYYAAFFFETADRYNLLGLSFTDDVTGNTTSFTVTGDEKVKVATFDKNSVTLNGLTHAFAAPTLHFTNEESVTAKAMIVNPSDKTIAVSVNWKLYDWDGLRPEALFDTKTELIELKAGEKKEVKYVIEPTGTAVSYIVAELKDGYSSSLLDIRFVRDNIPETRINFPSIGTYPLEAGQEASLFSCVHSTNLPVVPDNVLTLSLHDKDGNLIHTYEYQGDITGNMMGVADTFTPDKRYDYFTLTANLSRNGQVIEEVTQVYDCALIDETLCQADGLLGAADEDAENNLLNKNTSNYILIVVIFILIVVVGLIGFDMWKKRPVNIIGLFLLLVLGFGFGFVPGQVEAKTVSWSGSYCLNNYIFNCNGGRSDNRLNWNMQVNYNANIYNADTGAFISDGSVVPVGTKLRFAFARPSNYDASWFASGYTADSPYVYWDVPQTTLAEHICSYGSPIGFRTVIGDYVPNFLRGLVGATTPTVFYDHSGSTAGLSCNADGGVCTVLSAGSIKTVVNIASTNATMMANGDYSSFFGGCYDADSPLVALFAGEPWFVASFEPENSQTITIPARSIPFDLTAISNGVAPNAPVISGPITGNINESLNFTATASDADGDNVRYLFDWNNDGVGDQWSGGYVPSGTAQSLPWSWSAPGTYYFKAMTQDNQGNYSGWSAQYRVDVTAIVNGMCGVANGTSVANAPAVGLCLFGTANAVSGTNPGPFTWSCGGINGGTTASCSTIAVPPTLSLVANPDIVTLGNQSELTWTVTGATSCTGSTGGPSWDGVKAFAGTNRQFVTPLTFTIYRLSCTGPGGTIVKTTSVKLDAPNVSLDAAPSTIDAGGSTNISWTVTGATNCVASGDTWTGNKDVTGGTESISSTLDTTYTLTCTGPGGSGTDSVTVLHPAATITASPCTIPMGGSSCGSTVAWTTNNFLGTPNIYQGTTQFSSAASQVGINKTVNPDNKTFTVKDSGGRFEDMAMSSVTCDSGSVWNGTVCLELPSVVVLANPAIVRSGKTADITVSIDAAYDLNCSIDGAVNNTITHLAGSHTYNYTTTPLTSAQTVKVDCVSSLWPSVIGGGEARVNVIPAIEEV